MQARGETEVVHHPMGRQILNRDQVTAVPHVAAVLLGAVAAPSGDAHTHVLYL
jgi:hypothetical protein